MEVICCAIPWPRPWFLSRYLSSYNLSHRYFSILLFPSPFCTVFIIIFPCNPHTFFYCNFYLLINSSRNTFRKIILPHCFSLNRSDCRYNRRNNTDLDDIEMARNFQEHRNWATRSRWPFSTSTVLSRNLPMIIIFCILRKTPIAASNKWKSRIEMLFAFFKLIHSDILDILDLENLEILIILSLCDFIWPWG